MYPHKIVAIVVFCGFTILKVNAQSNDSTFFYIDNINVSDEIKTELRMKLMGNVQLPANFFKQSLIPNKTEVPKNEISGQTGVFEFKPVEVAFKKEVEHYPQLGSYEQYLTEFRVAPTSRTRFLFEAGVVKQSMYGGTASANQLEKPNYQLDFAAYLEHDFNAWLSYYMYGQYISPSLTNDNFVGPPPEVSDLFKQTEYGTGLKAKYKNLKADVGVKKTHPLNPGKFNPVKSAFRSKVTIGF